MKDVLGYDPSDIVGSNIADYIHPADYAKISSAKQLCKLREREREREGGRKGGREGGEIMSIFQNIMCPTPYSAANWPWCHSTIPFHVQLWAVDVGTE